MQLVRRCSLAVYELEEELDHMLSRVSCNSRPRAAIDRLTTGQEQERIEPVWEFRESERVDGRVRVLARLPDFELFD